MDVTAWSSGSGTYGVRVGKENRARHFKSTWNRIEVEIDGRVYAFALTPGFWKQCPEFRDSEDMAIRGWLQRHYTIDWPTGRPPRFQLFPLDGACFRLVG